MKSKCGVGKMKTKELGEAFSLPGSWRTVLCKGEPTVHLILIYPYFNNKCNFSARG